MNRRTFGILAMTAAVIFSLSGCDEFDVPITAEPTREIEPALLGDWLSVDDHDPRKYSKDRLRVRPYDRSTYIVVHGDLIYRAWHSDVEGLPLITLQSIDSEDRKYQYWRWDVSDDGAELTLRSINSDSPYSNGLMPARAADSATVVKIITANRDNVKLFGEAVGFSN